MTGLFETAIGRLEAVASRLEASETRLAGRSADSAPPSPLAAVASAASAPNAAPAAAPRAATGCSITAPPSPVGGTAALAAYNTAVMGALDKFMAAAAPLGDDIAKPSAVVEDAFSGERHIVAAIAACQQPDMPALQQLVGPVGEQMGKAHALTEGRRGPAFHHCKVVAEALGCLSWVVYTGPGCGMNAPAQHVTDAWQSAEFYANKVLMEHRGTNSGHVEWVKTLKELVLALAAYVREYHAAGPAWNPSGGPVSAFKGDVQPSPTATPAPKPAPPRPAGGPPPPPPPPGGPGSLLDRGPRSGDGGGGAVGGPPPRGALLAALNKGGSVTGGLRKVTDDMKTKNRADRSAAVPPAGAAAARAPRSSAGGGAGPKGPPRCELEGQRKWVIENQVDNREIVVEVTDAKQTAYIYGCSGSTIQIKGKLNAITLDQCTKTGLVFDSVVAACEVVNSRSVQVQCTGLVPTVAIDKVDGCQLYLSKESLTTAITTAKSSEVNVITPGAAEDDDFVEAPIPEQFVSTWKAGRWVTEPVSHSGG